jgi:predicted transcriptional regulator
MTPLQQRVNKYGSDAKVTRERFEKYFNSKEGAVSWQLKHVRSFGEDLATAIYKTIN